MNWLCGVVRSGRLAKGYMHNLRAAAAGGRQRSQY
jgi:hypothetical protein